MKEEVRELSASPAWLGKGHKRLQDSHECALGPFSWCVRAGIRGMRYVSTADTGMKTGNVERLQAPSTLEIALRSRERRTRVVCIAKCALLKGFLSAVCVSAVIPIPASSQRCLSPPCEGRCRAGFPPGWSDQGYSHSHGSFSSQEAEKRAESSSVSSKPGARRCSLFGEQRSDAGPHSTRPTPPDLPKGRACSGLGSPVPSVDAVSMTTGPSHGHCLVTGSQVYSPGKTAWGERCTGVRVIAQ